MKHPVSISISYKNIVVQDCFVPVEEKQAVSAVLSIRKFVSKQLENVERAEEYAPEEPAT